jgi:REP element-mobilizing transposase RayT
MKLLAVGGMPDHLHLLLSMPAKLPLAKAIQTLKGNSSHWLNKNFDVPGRFEWQTGYGAFSIGVKDIPRTRDYINNQKQHHKKMDCDTEFNAFLRKNGVGR